MKIFFEKDLEDIIYHDLTNKSITLSRGLELNHGSQILRQKKIGNYGIADLIVIKKTNISGHRHYDISIIELKSKVIGIQAFFQALRYIKGIKSYLSKRIESHKIHLNYSIILIGERIDKSGAFCYIPELISDQQGFKGYGCITNIDFYTYRYDVEGLFFDKMAPINLKNEGF